MSFHSPDDARSPSGESRADPGGRGRVAVRTMVDDVPDASEEEQYENRSRSVRAAIDAVAEHDPGELDEYGAMARIAREHDVKYSTVRYVLERFDHLVSWRRQQFRSAMHPDAAQNAYDDERLEALADGGAPRVDITLSLADAYRATHSLPSDLATDVWIQTVEAASRLDTNAVRRSFEHDIGD